MPAESIYDGFSVIGPGYGVEWRLQGNRIVFYRIAHVSFLKFLMFRKDKKMEDKKFTTPLLFCYPIYLSNSGKIPDQRQVRKCFSKQFLCLSLRLKNSSGT